MPNSDASEPPSTPPAQNEEIQVATSPSHQRDLHQKKHRRGSVIPPMDFNNPDEFSSSPCSRASINDDEDETQTFITAEEENDDSNSDDNDLVEGESTMTGVDAGDLTAHSHGDSSTGSSGRLEEALRLAARQAGTQGIEYDENGDISMELADDEVTSAFQPWMNESKYVPPVRGVSTAFQEENVNPFSPAFGASATKATEPNEAGKTMEFTQSVSTILRDINQVQPFSNNHLQLAGASVGRSNAGGRRRSTGDSSVFGDETMDLTTAIGTIHQSQPALNVLGPVESSDSGDENEELSMEFTSAVGGLLEQFRVVQDKSATPDEKRVFGGQLLEAINPGSRQSSLYAEEKIGITMTAHGSLSSISEHTEPAEDQTMEMDVTTAVGAILSQELSDENRSEARQLMKTQTGKEHPTSSPFSDNLPPSSRPSTHIATVTSEAGSPILMSSQRRINAVKPPSQRRSTTPTTPKSVSRQSSPTKKLIIPSDQRVPKFISPSRPSNTSPYRNIVRKTASPKTLLQPEAQHESPAPQIIQAAQLFTKDSHTGEATPSIVLKPGLRRSSGMGIDKPGLGSPRVTALLNRRRSIGEDAKTFTLQKEASKSVVFEDPQAMKDNLESQFAENERFLDKHDGMQKHIGRQDFGEERDLTANLKDLIESLTPRKKKLNGRKSLHVGAAKGLLGKRPVELDEDDDEDSTPKRLKGREGSPVKKVRLPAPPSKTQTTGRITRSARRSLEETTGSINISTPTQSGKTSGLKSRKDDENSRHAEHLLKIEKPLHASQEKVETQDPDAVESKNVADRVHLQDFLNMTSIQFMELTTTKRRLTVVPNLMSENAANKPAGVEDKTAVERKGSELEQCVAAGACTIPMLELYQHVSFSRGFIIFEYTYSRSSLVASSRDTSLKAGA